MRKRIICSILSFVMAIGLVLPYLNPKGSTVVASGVQEEVSSWKFSETVTEANDSSIWKAVFMWGNSTNPTNGTAYATDLAWHASDKYFYSTALGASFGIVNKTSLATGSAANAVNRRPAMEFTAPKEGNVKIALDNIGYQSVTNMPVLLVYKIDAEGTYQNVASYTDATTMQEHYYNMQVGEKLYVALQSTGSQCQVTVDPIVTYVDEVYEARNELDEDNTGIWQAKYNYPGNTDAGDAVWYAAGNYYRAANLDGAWGYIFKDAIQIGTNPNRLPSQVFNAPRDGQVKLHFNAITTNGAFQTVTVFTRREGVVTTVDTLTIAGGGKTYSLDVLKGDEIGISYTNGTVAYMKCSPVVYYLKADKEEITAWKFSQTVTEANNSSIWKAVFMWGDGSSPTSATTYAYDLKWHAGSQVFYDANLGGDFGLVYKNSLVTGGIPNAVNRRPAMEFTAPKTGNVKVSFDEIRYQDVTNMPILLVYHIDADGNFKNVKTYNQNATSQECLYSMKEGEKLYVALQSKGSQCTVNIDPVVSYFDGDIEDTPYTYNAYKNYDMSSGVDTKGVWKYQYRSSKTSTTFTDMEVVSEDRKWWTDSRDIASIYFTEDPVSASPAIRLAAHNQTYEAVLTFVAPYSGMIEITMDNGGVHAQPGAINDNGRFTLLRNGTVIESMNLDATDLYFTNSKQLWVDKGDSVRFSVGRERAESLLLFMNPEIVYTEISDISYQQYLSPIWEGDTVYNESVMPLSNKDGSVSPIRMAYEIEEVISVKSADLATTYQENVDYKVVDGELVIPTGSNIKVTDYADYYLDNAISGNSFGCTNGGYIYFSEGSYFHSKQIVVTYKHTDQWNGSVPKKQGKKLSNINKKLNDKEPLNVVFYGDSITVGANASGFVNAAPYMETYPELVVKALKNNYLHNDITYVNTAVGGKTSSWGAENAQALAADKNPDLLVIGFGMNDGATSVADYQQNIETIVNTVRQKNAECDIVLVATMMPNKEVSGFYGNQVNFLSALRTIASKYKNVAVADMTTMHQDLLEYKAYRDMTGNNVNHPNDFMSRVYAQVILETLTYADDEEQESPWRFSETVTEENDSSIWKAVFMWGDSTAPTNGTTYATDLAWHTSNKYFYATSLGAAFGVVNKNGLATGSVANAVNRRPTMEFTAPKAGNYKVVLDNVSYQSVTNMPVLLVYKIDLEGTCQNVVTYIGNATMQEHYYNMQAGEKLYVALQSTGSQCSVNVDPVVHYLESDISFENITLKESSDNVQDYTVSWVTSVKSTEPKVQIVKKTSEAADFSSAMVFVGASDDGITHSATFTGLEYDSSYYYRVGDSKLNIWSATSVFTTKEEPDPEGVYSFKKGYTENPENTGIWQYYVREIVTDSYTPLEFNATTKRWEAPEKFGSAWIWKGAMYPSMDSNANRDYQTVLRFVAPKDGMVEISFPDGITVAGDSADGVKFSLWANSSSGVLFDQKLYNAGNTTIQSYKTSVTKGQKIHFLLHRNITNAGDTIWINPTITYQKDYIVSNFEENGIYHIGAGENEFIFQGTGYVDGKEVENRYWVTEPGEHIFKVTNEYQYSKEFKCLFYRRGDVNTDGKIDDTDVKALKKAVSGTKLTGAAFLGGDMDEDNKITDKDVEYLQEVLKANSWDIGEDTFRGIMVNIDVNSSVWPFLNEVIDSGNVTKEALYKFVDIYADTQVTDIAFNIFCQNSNTPSNVWDDAADLYARKEENGVEVDYTDKYKGIAGMYETELDVYKIWIERCREQGMKAWLSIRMNDHHGWDGDTSVFRSEFFYEAKEKGWLLEYANGYNYGIPEIREKMLLYIEEQLLIYDCDGLELDWLREVFCLSDDDKKNFEIMNDFMREVNKIVAKAEAKWGHDIQILCHMPRDIETCEEYGFDVTTWSKEGLCDVIAPSSRFWSDDSDMPIDEWKVACRNTKIYAGLSGTVIDNTHLDNYQTVAGYMNQYYSQGADKCYLFNLFCCYGYYGKDDEDFLKIYRTCGDVKTVSSIARRNIVTNADLWVPNQYLPLPLEVSAKREESLSIATGPINGFALLLIAVEKGEPMPTVTINGVKCTSMGEYNDTQRIASAADTLYAYIVPLSALKEIRQELTFAAEKNTTITYIEFRTDALATEFTEKPTDVIEEYRASEMGKEWSYFERFIDGGSYKELVYDKTTNSYIDAETGAKITADSQNTGKGTGIQTARVFTAPYSGTIRISFADDRITMDKRNEIAYLRIWKGENGSKEILLEYLMKQLVELGEVELDIREGEKLYFIVGSLNEADINVTVDPIISYTRIGAVQSDEENNENINGSGSMEGIHTGDSNTFGALWCFIISLVSIVVMVVLKKRKQIIRTSTKGDKVNAKY